MTAHSLELFDVKASTRQQHDVIVGSVGEQAVIEGMTPAQNGQHVVDPDGGLSVDKMLVGIGVCPM